MRLVLFSDLHLDAAFAWIGRPDVARRRREALRRTLVRISDLARAEKAAALLVAGDLYEHERFTPDTAAFLKQTFAGLHPMPVYIAPGNHDWFGPQSLYRRVTWTDNVHVFEETQLVGVSLDDGLTLWGAAHGAPAGTPGFLSGFRVDRGGIHLALFHGSEQAALYEQEDGKSPHAPFDADDIPRAGLHHAFVGHYHVPRDAAYHTYAGNPEPLTFGEGELRGAVVATVESNGTVTRQRHAVATTTLHDKTVDLTGATSRYDVRERVVTTVRSLSGMARLTLEGELGRDLDLVPGDLLAMSREMEGPDGPAPELEALMLRFGTIRNAVDLAAIRTEPTVRGQFVRDVLDAELEPELCRRVLATGLRALDGRADLEVP